MIGDLEITVSDTGVESLKTVVRFVIDADVQNQETSENLSVMDSDACFLVKKGVKY